MAIATPNGRTFNRSGFVQSLKLLFAQQFSRPGKVWKMEIKSEQMVKSVDVFFFGGEFLFFILVKSYSISPVCSQRTWKKLCFFVFKVSTDQLFDNLESEKRNIIVLGKSQENVLEFGSKNLYESWKVDCLQSAFLFKFRWILIPAGRLSNCTPSIAFCWL